LAEADNEQIRKLARRAYHRMHESANTIDWRIDLFVEALLSKPRCGRFASWRP
jgi:hypothetical protein